MGGRSLPHRVHKMCTPLRMRLLVPRRFCLGTDLRTGMGMDTNHMPLGIRMGGPQGMTTLSLSAVVIFLHPAMGTGAILHTCVGKVGNHYLSGVVHHRL